MQSRYSINQKKNKPYLKWLFIIGSVLMAVVLAFWLYLHDWDIERSLEAVTGSDSTQTIEDEETEPEPTEEAHVPEPVVPGEPDQDTKETPAPEDSKLEEPAEPTEEEKVDATKYPENYELPTEPTVINGILLVNKQNPLPEDYAPGEQKKVKDAFEAMRQDALAQGIDLIAFSTYRNFEYQKQLYEGYVAKDGVEEADRYSARPGFSEHQTGLAFDIGVAGQEQHWASQSFGDTEGGKWLAVNAHRYGFILRYPENSEHITGYMHESWHFRYVGTEIATAIYEQGITLEEYLGVYPGQ